MKKNKVPEIRFPGFTDDWEQRKLGDYAEILTGGTPKTSISEYWEPKKIPWMSSGEVNKRHLDGTDNMISEEGLNNSSARWVKKHSVLIALAGQGKTRGTVAVNNIQLTTNQSIAAIVPNDNLHYEFIYQNLIKRYDELRMISSGDGTRGGLNKQIISDVVIKSPSKDEQIKIGTFFKQLDNTIALHQRELEILKNTKKGFLQKMFPKEGKKVPEVRFSGFTNDWEQYKLGELGKTQSGIGFSDAEQGGSEGIPFYKVSDMNNVGNENEMTNANNYVSDEQIKRKKWKPIETVPAVMFAKVGAAIMLNRKRLVTSSFLIDNNTMAYVFDESWDIDFGKTLFETIHLPRHAQVGALPSYNGSDIESIDIKVPIKDEQQKIGNFFKQLDNTITIHQRELTILQNTKKAFLQKMFV